MQYIVIHKNFYYYLPHHLFLSTTQPSVLHLQIWHPLCSTFHLVEQYETGTLKMEKREIFMIQFWIQLNEMPKNYSLISKHFLQ